MQKVQLGNSHLNVTKVCLGTMTWGEQNTEAEAHSQLDYASSAASTSSTRRKCTQ
jgi:aryl-alcohol dehydrogenase-like predicted oxidoreductase